MDFPFGWVMLRWSFGWAGVGWFFGLLEIKVCWRFGCVGYLILLEIWSDWVSVGWVVLVWRFGWILLVLARDFVVMEEVVGFGGLAGLD